MCVCVCVCDGMCVCVGGVGGRRVCVCVLLCSLACQVSVCACNSIVLHYLLGSLLFPFHSNAPIVELFPWNN